MHTVVADELATPRVASVPDAQTQIGSGGMGNSSSRREARQRDVYQPPVAGAAPSSVSWIVMEQAHSAVKSNST